VKEKSHISKKKHNKALNSPEFASTILKDDSLSEKKSPDVGQ
jgi:hypothetical protein